MKIAILVVVGLLAVLSRADQTGISIGASICSLDNIQRGLTPLIVPSVIENGTLVDEVKFGNWLGSLSIENLEINPKIVFDNVKLKLAWLNATNVYYSLENLEVNLQFSYAVKLGILPALTGSGKVNASGITGELSATYVDSKPMWDVIFKEDTFQLASLDIQVTPGIINGLLSLFRGWIKSEIVGIIPTLVQELNDLIVHDLDSSDPRRMQVALTEGVAINATFSASPVLDQADDYALMSMNGLVYNNVTLQTYAPHNNAQPIYYTNAWREQVHISDNTILSGLYELWAQGKLPSFDLTLSDSLNQALATAIPELATAFGAGAGFSAKLELVAPFNFNFKAGMNVAAQGMFVTFSGKQANASEFTEALTLNANLTTFLNPYSHQDYVLKAAMQGSKSQGVKVIDSSIGDVTLNATRIATFLGAVDTEVTAYPGYNLASLVPPQYALATMLLTNVTLAVNQTAGYLLAGLSYNIDPFMCKTTQ